MTPMVMLSGLFQACQQGLDFACSNLAYLRKTLLESRKIFFERARHVVRIRSEA